MADKYEVAEGGDDDKAALSRKSSSSVAEWSDAVEEINDDSSAKALLSQSGSSTGRLPVEQQRLPVEQQRLPVERQLQPVQQQEPPVEEQMHRVEQQMRTVDLKDLPACLLDELGLKMNSADKVVPVDQESEPSSPTDWADGTTYEDDPDRLNNDALLEASPTTAFLNAIKEAFIQREFIQEQIDDCEARLADLRADAAKYDAVLEGVADIVNQAQ